MANPTGRSRWRWLWIPVRFLLLIYLGLGLVLWLTQRRLIYLPSDRMWTTPQAEGLTGEDWRIATADGVSLHAWWLPHPDGGSDRPVLVLAHGNAGNISNNLGSAPLYHAAGCHALLFDWRGYGQSDGDPHEAGLYADIAAVWQELVDRRGIAPHKIFVHGQSLGGGPASWLAGRNAIGGLILDSTYTSLVDLGQELYPVYPAGLILSDRFPSRDHLANVSCPVLVLHSPQDRHIPFHHGESLHAAAREPKRLVRLQGDHNDVLMLSEDIYRRELAAFVAAAATTCGR